MILAFIAGAMLACAEAQSQNHGGMMDASVFEAGVAADTGGVTFDAGNEPLPGPVNRDRSLVWIQPELLDEPEIISLATLMSAAANMNNGGPLFDWLLREFGRTEFSKREDQTNMAEELRRDLGPDPASWDLSLAPFKLTAVHLRIDLASEDHCGEFRASLSTTHQTVQPFHLIFLFQMNPEASDDRCRQLGIRLARLSEMPEPEFLEAAKAFIQEHVRPERFILLETAEFTFTPWEWRQWMPIPNTSTSNPSLPHLLENPPAFQAVDIAGLNPPSDRRDTFIAWVEANASAINRRRILIPEEFRSRNPTAVAGQPRQPLSLFGISDEIRTKYPDLRRNLEIVGCPACHTTGADFVHTTKEREFSEFYDKELNARKALLDNLVNGIFAYPPFGPLQANPSLPD